MPFMPVHEPRRLTQDDYLSRERADARHHYLDGTCTPVPTESVAHRRLCRNLQKAIQPQIHHSIANLSVHMQPLLAAAPQRPYSTTGLFCYPDIAIVMGPPQYHDEQLRAIRNPTVLIEVCSPETEAFDAGEKFQRYRHALPTLQEYVLIAEDRCEVGYYQRVGGDQWPLTCYTDLSVDVVMLNRILCRLALSDVYAGVLVETLEAPEHGKEEEEPWQWHERTPIR
jgi:Uma2 family endonuclease